MNKDLPESPTSVTYSITSPKGYNALLTVRDGEFGVLSTKMSFVEEWLDKKGYKPQVRGFAKKEIEYLEGKKCPACGGRMIKKTTKQGKEFHKCENGKWNPTTNQNEGCSYVDWLNPQPEHDGKHPYDGETIPVEAYDE
jgi:hypothetical protein